MPTVFRGVTAFSATLLPGLLCVWPVGDKLLAPSDTTVTIVSGPSWLQLSGSGFGLALVGTPPAGFADSTVHLHAVVPAGINPARVEDGAFSFTNAAATITPGPGIFTAIAYTATAHTAASFGWAISDKVKDPLSSLALTILSGPSWLMLSSGMLTGTPTDATANYTAVVVLRAVFGTYANSTSFTKLTVSVSATSLTAPARWLAPGPPYNLTVIAGQPFTWSFAARITPPDATVSLALHGTSSPEWIAFSASAKTITGAAPTSAIGTVATVNLLAGSTANAALQITVLAPPPQLWAGDPYEITARALESLTFDYSGRLLAGSSVTLLDAPGWLSLDASTIVGVPPAEAEDTAVVVHLRAANGSIIDTATLTIHVTMPGLFINAPYAITRTEGRSFLFQIATTDPAAVVVASDLPPWLIFNADVLTFSGTPPLGSGDTVLICGLKATLDAQIEETSLTITISPLDALEITVDLRNHQVLFDGSAPTFKHGDDQALRVNFIPVDQAGDVSNVIYRVKAADELAAYGEILKNTVSAKVGSTNAFQFASQTFSTPELDHLLALADPVEVQPSLGFLFEVECLFQGRRFTTIIAPINIARDFALDTEAGAAGSESGSGSGSGGSGPLVNSSLVPVTFTFGGVLAAGQTFGSFFLPVPMSLVGAQIVDIQEPDPDATVTVNIVDSTDQPYFGFSVGTEGGGEASAVADFSANPLFLAAGLTVGVRLDYTPSAEPAQNLTVALLFRQ